MKTLKTWIIVGLLALASLLSTTSNAFAQTTGNYVTGDQRSGQFSVPANLEAGVTLTNKTNQEVKVTLSTEGTWNLSNDIKNLDANGLDPKYLPSDSLKYLQYPDKTPFSLVAASQDKDQPRVYQVGTKSELTIAPGATFAFLANDIRSAVAPDSYKDNTGSIVVKWSTPTVKLGKIVVNNDEWTLSDTGFTSAPDAATFAINIAKWFTGGRSTGKFHAYSTNFEFTGSKLAQTLTQAGYTWTVGTNIKLDLPTLLTYDGIFVGGNAADNQVLIDYVKAGGNVYLSGGTGFGGAQAEANSWNTFLNAFGLKFQDVYNGIGGNQTINSSHPIFTGVKLLYENSGNSITSLDSTSQTGKILVTDATGKQGLYAVADGI